MTDQKGEALRSLDRLARESGVIPEGSTGVVLVSGGPDSACAAAALAGLAEPGGLVALHVNYGLRAEADRDESTCRELCAMLRIDLRVERPGPLEGNLQAAARDARYALAERLRERVGADWIATGHTRTDLAETVLYRLAASPGRRSLLGLPARRGRIVRPVLGAERAETRALASAAGLPFADDATNLDPRFARNRIREQALPALRSVSEAAERNIAETRTELAEEAAVLERLVAEALDSAGASGSGQTAAVPAEALELVEPAVRRLALRELAERAAGREVALGRERAARIWRQARDPEGGIVELGDGLRAVCELGTVRFEVDRPEEPPDPVRLQVPGRVRFGHWEVRAELHPPPVTPSGPELATLDAGALGRELTVRAWREGDRMRPLGLGGTKTLQDLFTDSKVPRSMRGRLPVVCAGGRVAWVAGVAVADEFKITRAAREVAVITARIPHG